MATASRVFSPLERSPIKILGVLTSTDELPTGEDNDRGDAYIIDQNLWIWNGIEWQDAGELRGPQGDLGPSLRPRGSVATENDLPLEGNQTGDIYTVGSHVWGWDGSAWVDLGAFAAGVVVHVRDTEPPAAQVGDLWYDPTGETLGSAIVDPGRVAEIESAIDRAIPADDPPSSAKAYIESISGIKRWTKRRYVLAEEDFKSSGVVDVAGAVAAGAGNDVVFDYDPDLTYSVPVAGITVPARTNIRVSGSHQLQLAVPAGATGAAMFNLTSGFDATIEGLDIDLGMDATMLYGFRYFSQNHTETRKMRLSDVRVRNAAGAGLYSWHTIGLELERFVALDCVIGVHLFNVKGYARLIRPYIVNAVAGRMKYGISISASSPNLGLPEGYLLIDAPEVGGADYPSPNGSSAHGISIYRSAGVRVRDPLIYGCGNPANAQGGGIVFSGESHWSQLEGGVLRDNNAAGIWTEVVPSGDITLGTDTSERGVSVRGTRLIRNKMGASSSYGAGTVFVDVWAIDNDSAGFVTDAEDTTYIGCRAVNNWANPDATRPAQNGGVKAGFRAYGNANFRNEYAGRYIGCDSYDNRTVPQQEYGFAAEDRGYRFEACNGGGSLGEFSGGTTNNKFTDNNW